MLTTRVIGAAVVAALAAASPAAARVKPVAALSGPATVKAGQRATFDASASRADPAGSIVEYAWDLDGDGSYDQVREGARITIVPEQPGEHRITVRVTDDAGATSTASGQYLVEGLPPVARITLPSSVTAGVPVVLDASSSTSPSGAVVSYAWNLDGGGFGPDSGEPTVTWTFPDPGSHTVVLRVRDAAQGQGTVRRTIEVAGPDGVGSGAGSGATGGSRELGIAPLDSIARRWLTRRSFAAIGGAPRRRLASARRGLWVNLLADRPVRFVLGVHVPRRAARRLGLRGPAEVARHLRVARARSRLPVAGQRAYRISLPRAVRRALRRPVRLLVSGYAVDAAGNRARVQRSFALRR